MLAPPTTDVSYGGIRFTIEPPDSAEAALEGDIYHRIQSNENLCAGMPRERDMRATIRWCVAHIVHADGPFEGEWEDMTEAERVDVVDRYVALPGLNSMRRAIVELGSLPEQFIDDVRELYRVGSGGGCECPVCRGAKPDTEANRVNCLYGDISDDVQSLAVRVTACGESVDLADPWWMYQIIQARSIGRSQALQERKQESNQKESASKVLKSRGKI